MKVILRITAILTAITSLFLTACGTLPPQTVGEKKIQTLRDAGLTESEIRFYHTYIDPGSGLVPGDAVPVSHDDWEFTGTRANGTWKKNGKPSTKAPIHLQQAVWIQTHKDPTQEVAYKWEKVGSSELYSPTQCRIVKKLAAAGIKGHGPGYGFALTQDTPVAGSSIPRKGPTDAPVPAVQ